jgi:competence protein ComEC
MKKILKFIPVQLVCGIIPGIVFASYFNIALYAVIAALIVAFSFLLLIYLVNTYRYSFVDFFAPITLIIAFLIGMFSTILHQEYKNPNHYSQNAEFDTRHKHFTTVKITSVLKPTSFFNKYEAKVQELNSNFVQGKILVNVAKDSANSVLKVDDILLAKVKFATIPPSRNPYTFNYSAFLNKRNIYHQIYLEHTNFSLLDSTLHSVAGYAHFFRKNINSKLIENGFGNNELAVINALLLGQRHDISADLMDKYSGAGAIHILAVSGLHIGIVLLILSIIFSPLHYFKKGKTIASILIIITLWCYAILAGLSPSIIRAVTMFTALTIGMYVNRPSNIYNNLFISIFFLLLYNPMYIFEIGFQLSYLAVIAIVWLQPKFYALWQPKYWMFKKIWQLLTVSFAAQLGVLPLSLYYFHQFPGLFFLTNIVVIPFLGLILMWGFLTIALALFNILPFWFVWSYNLVIKTLNNFIAWVAGNEIFIVENIRFSFVAMVCSYFFIVFFFKWTEKKYYYRLILGLLAIIIFQTYEIVEKYKREMSGELVVFHANKTQLIGLRLGAHIDVYSPNILHNFDDNTLESYQVGTGVKSIKILKEKPFFFEFNAEKILVIDSLGLYNVETVKPTILILSHSPKLNLDRVLLQIKPKIVVADGSNYTSAIRRWEETCAQNKTPFHSTWQKGAYVLKKE